MKPQSSKSLTALDKKISVRLLIPLLDQLSAAAEACFIRRDALLDDLLAKEIEEFESELILPNPAHARAYIDGHLKRQLSSNGKQLSIALKSSTVERIEEVCSEKNVPRDAFINRLLFVLAAPRHVLDEHLFHLSEDEAADLNLNIDNAWNKIELAAGYQPLDVLRRALTNPFEAYREIIEKTKQDDGQDGLFTRYLDDDLLVGLNCFVPDACIPGQAAYNEAQKKASVWLLQHQR